MKFIIPGMLCMLLALSCTRTNQQNTTPPGNSSSAVLDSAYFYSTGPKEIYYSATRFTYDDQGRFTGTYATSADSNLNHQPAIRPDTSTLVLTYNGTDTVPATYRYNDLVNIFPGGAPGPSSLSYDAQDRIILDSPMNPIYTVRFGYGNGYISFAENSFSADTMFITNGNISGYDVAFGGLTTYSYSNNPNPYYLPKLATTAGIALFNTSGGFDMISKNLFSQKISSSAHTYNYTWTLNTDGRVISGIGTDQDTGQPVDYYWFVYKK
jgi:hypothetical protein